MFEILVSFTSEILNDFKFIYKYASLNNTILYKKNNNLKDFGID